MLLNEFCTRTFRFQQWEKCAALWSWTVFLGMEIWRFHINSVEMARMTNKKWPVLLGQTEQNKLCVFLEIRPGTDHILQSSVF